MSHFLVIMAGCRHHNSNSVNVGRAEMAATEAMPVTAATEAMVERDNSNRINGR